MKTVPGLAGAEKARLGDKEQADMALSLLKLDLGDLDRQREDAYEEHKLLNRDILCAKVELDCPLSALFLASSPH